MSCHFQLHLQSKNILCIQEDLSLVSFHDFWMDVWQQSIIIKNVQADEWALWENDSYEFLVLFFAGLLANKQMVLAPNRIKDTEQELAGQGIHFLSRQRQAQQHQQIDLKSVLSSIQLDDEFLNQAQVYFYTSGSTGQPKKIPRTLRQLLNEVQGLNQSFGWSEQNVALATVSHQHIYGLLFKLLLPLATGQSFYNAQLPFPENVVEAQRKLAKLQIQNYLISSPALLKRWTMDVRLQDCICVFSSGGQLNSGVRPFLNRPVVEVLGSSETGGIAYRQHDDALWTPFANVDIQVTAQEELGVRSNHAFSEEWILTGDRVQASEPDQPKSQFTLLGRLDRLVKLEEKRLSLDAIEHKIVMLNEVAQCHVLLVEHDQRQILACVAVLTEQAQQQLCSMAKSQFIQQLKEKLQGKLETIAIPRQWRFLSQLPQNSQSKLNKNDLKALFQPMTLPVVIQQTLEVEHAVYRLDFIPELVCFKGHFPDYPIYPGVGQIGFIQHFAKQCWADLDWCNGYEQLKFQDLIRPYASIQLTLTRHAHKIVFEMLLADKIIASGRLLFKLIESPEQESIT